ncbi:MAG: hypothetical protein NT105_23175 [Verrucomicrobia bacterium]|nr:hypothetical protein [Verrucomicrobiota bacterium]
MNARKNIMVAFRCGFVACVALLVTDRSWAADVESLRLKVPVYREIRTHIHRPADLKPGEKRPGVLLIGEPGCKLAAKLATTQRLVATHFSPAENIPKEFRSWEGGLGHAGQDAAAILLKHLLALPEVDKDNVGLVTFSFGVVGGTGALARHPELVVKFLIDWEGPSGPQNLRWVPPDHKIVRNHPATDKAFWQERTASEFIKRIRCRYLRVQSDQDHVQVLGDNQHAIEMLNSAAASLCPWTRCNDNPPNIRYDAAHPERERGKWFPGKAPRADMEKIVLRYVEEMTRMPGLAAKETAPQPQSKIEPQNTRSTRPIYFTFGFHWDNPVRREREGPVRGSVAVREMTDLLERLGIRAHYGFVGAVAQQLAEDFPDTVAKIRKLKLDIGYHPGAGHNRRGPHAPLPDVRGLAADDAIRALWTFETRARYPNDDQRAGQPIPNMPGGWLAIQTALGVTPLQTDAGGHGALYEALGAGYPMSADESSDALTLPELHEIHIYGDSARFVVPPSYYGWRAGEFAPVTVDVLDWFRILAENLPRDRAFGSRLMSHANMEPEVVERLVGFMKRRGDFCVTAPDPDGWQWKPENSPLGFYQKRYGVKTLADVMTLPPPLDVLRPRFNEEATELGWLGRPRTEVRNPKPETRNPSPITHPPSLSRNDILLAADHILSHWPRCTHDGDFGGPPPLVQLDDKRSVSLADAFQAFVLAIEQWRTTGSLPDSVALKPLRGPVDFPTHRVEAAQTLDHTRRLQGYEPNRIPRAALPDPDVVARQGLPSCGDYYLWIPTHTKADADDVLAAIARVAEKMSDRVPGVVSLNLLCHAARGEPDAKRRTAINPAEFLYALAQEYRALATRGKPNDVMLVSAKVAPRQICKLLLPLDGDRLEGFIYRGYLSPDELDAAWTRTKKE